MASEGGFKVDLERNYGLYVEEVTDARDNSTVAVRKSSS